MRSTFSRSFFSAAMVLLLAMLLAGVLYVPMKRYFAGSDILK